MVAHCSRGDSGWETPPEAVGTQANTIAHASHGGNGVHATLIHTTHLATLHGTHGLATSNTRHIPAKTAPTRKEAVTTKCSSDVRL